MHLLNSTQKKLAMYSYQGNKQLFLDSIPIVEDSVSFYLPKDVPTGYYRFVAGEAVVDLILTNENVEVKADLAKPEQGVEIIQSEENKHLYDFYKAYSDATADNTISCEKVKSLYETYTSNAKTPLACQSISFFLSSLNCETSKTCLSSFLNSAPFSFGLLQTIISQEVASTKSTGIIDEIISCSDTSNEVRHSIYLAAYESALLSNQPEVISYLIQKPFNSMPSELVAQNVNDQQVVVAIGDVFPTSEVVADYQDRGSKLTYIIISDSSDPQSNQTTENIKKYLLSTKEEFFMVDAATITQSVKLSIGYMGGDMAFMVGKGSVLADKWIGKVDLLNLR
jgi:hypothetical protein